MLFINIVDFLKFCWKKAFNLFQVKRLAESYFYSVLCYFYQNLTLFQKKIRLQIRYIYNLWRRTSQNSLIIIGSSNNIPYTSFYNKNCNSYF